METEEYLTLPVAAHLVRSQLVPNPARAYDPQHLGEMLNVAAQALLRVTRLSVFDPQHESRTPVLIYPSFYKEVHVNKNDSLNISAIVVY